MNRQSTTALESGLISCGNCHLLSRKAETGNVLKCPACGTSLHQRKRNSISRTWAFVLASLILYIPANLLPVTRVVSFGQTQSDTIMSGVIYFIATGMWPIALIIFVASVMVPLLKLLILTFLLISVQRKSSWRRKDRTRLYRITEAIGRWSMVDIFVVTVLVGLVNLGSMASVYAGPGAVFFAAVVVLTMLGAMSFDPRLIWDKKGF